MPVFNFPTGTILPHASPSVPIGWVKCDGGVYDGTTENYEALWGVLGLTYGGSNQASFRVPNLGNRVPVGVKASTSGSGLDGPVGSWSGATATTLTAAQTGVKSHYHDVTDNGHSHGLSHSQNSHTHSIRYAVFNAETKNGNRGINSADGGNPSTYPSDGTATSMSMQSANLASLSVNSTSDANASSSHSNLQPSLYLEYIIKL